MEQKEQKKCNITKIVATVVCMAILILFVCMACRMNCVRSTNCENACNLKKDTVIVVVDTATYASGDADSRIQKINDYSSEIANYKYKVDSLSIIVDKVNGQYASTIDMLIDKFNTWVGFWLAVLSLVLLFVSFWQYLKIEKYDDKIKQLEADISERMEKSEKEYKKIKDKFQADFDKQQANFDKQISTHKFSTLENRMTSLLLCMSSVPDPQVFSDSNERKEQISYYLDLVSNLLIEYFKMIKQEYNNLSKDTIDCIPMVLLNLRLSMVRIQGVFRDPSIYVEFVGLIKEIETNESNIRRTKLLDCRKLECFAALIERFNVFKTHVNNCKDVV